LLLTVMSVMLHVVLVSPVPSSPTGSSVTEIEHYYLLTNHVTTIYNKDMNNEPLFPSHSYPIFEESVQRGKQRLRNVTFCMGEPPMRELLWCDKRKGR
jgi:hypothetical protein